MARRNLECLRAGKGTPVTARISGEGIEILDPLLGRTERIFAGDIYP